MQYLKEACGTVQNFLRDVQSKSQRWGESGMRGEKGMQKQRERGDNRGWSHVSKAS